MIDRPSSLFFLLITIALSLTSCLNAGDDNDEEYFAVIRVVDGDTFWIDDSTEKGKKIRLIGIDAPEVKSTPRKQAGHYGKEARAYLAKLLSNEKVRLEYDVDHIDRYGRTLAYAYLRDGTFINAELVKRGYATVMTVPPNVKFSAEFVELQRKARENHRGLWDTR